MMPLGESVKNTIYFKNNNGEYEEIKECKITTGISLVAEGLVEAFKDVADKFVELGKSLTEFSADIDIKTISKKRFKKLLMGKGIQRNIAEEICNIEFKNKGYYTMIDLLKY